MENRTMAGFSVAKWRQIMSVAVAFALFTNPAISPSANAASTIYQKQGRENYDPPADIKYDHESRSMSVKIFDDNKDLLIVTIAFAVNVSSTSFSSSSTILRIKFMPTLTNFKGNTGDVWVEAPKAPYQGAKKIPAPASSYATATSSPNDPRKDMSACGALTWMDDVPARNLVSFQVSRDCLDIPNSFWAVSQVETDIYNSSIIKDVRYTPIEPFSVDLTSIPRPPKAIPKKNQTITASTQQKEYFVDLKTGIEIFGYSGAGGILQFSSKTPAVCNVSLGGGKPFIFPQTSGSCQIAVDAAGNETFNPAPTAYITVTFIKKSQKLYFDPPGEVYLNEKMVTLDLSAESGLPVQVVSTSPSVCSFPYQATDPTAALLLDSGICGFKVTQAGDATYNANEGYASFEIYPNPTKTVKPSAAPSTKSTAKPKPKPSPSKVAISGTGSASGGGAGGTSITGGGNVSGSSKKTITCTKSGWKDQKVTGVNPKCPTGYKKK